MTAADLLGFDVPGGEITEEGLRGDVRVGVQYLASWLRGVGAAGISNLMEDAATAEIARSQVWQWVHHRARLKEGADVSRELILKVEDEELDKIRQAIGHAEYSEGRFDDARALFDRVALDDDFIEFLTIPAYALLD